MADTLVTEAEFDQDGVIIHCLISETLSLFSGPGDIVQGKNVPGLWHGEYE
jgi:hypothetical protein